MIRKWHHVWVCKMSRKTKQTEREFVSDQLQGLLNFKTSAINLHNSHLLIYEFITFKKCHF